MGSHTHHTTPGMAHPHQGVTMQQPQMHYAQAQPQQLQGQMQMQPQLHYQQIQKQQLQLFWQQQVQEMEQVNVISKAADNRSSLAHTGRGFRGDNKFVNRMEVHKLPQGPATCVPVEALEFKNHQLPLARIKKIMKSDEDVKMIAAEAPVLFAKACEMFILELTLRSWIHTEENKRRTLQRNDIAGAITRGDIFDFLVDIVPRDELKDEDLGVPWNGVAADPNPYGGIYYPTMAQPAMGHHQMTNPEMMVVQTSMAQNPQMMYQPPQ